MIKLITSMAVGFSLIAASPALAGERTATLAIQNMDCAACPYIVRESLKAVPGVSKIVVSVADKTVIVTYDDTKADLDALTAATTNVGYPSAPQG